MIRENSLSEIELERYSRQILVPDFGLAAQKALKNSQILCIGAGGLGSAIITYLAASGIGTLGVVDDDIVERSNLSRQILHAEARVGISKVQSAAGRVSELNPECKFIGIEARLNRGNAREILQDYDLILEGSDNSATKYLSHDIARELGKSYIWGAIYHTAGQVMTFQGADIETRGNIRDIFPQIELDTPDSPPRPPNGVFSPVCGIIGSIMAAEAVKILSGFGELLTRKMLILDALNMRSNLIYLDKK